MQHRDIDFLQSELSRVSEWLRFADSKAGFLSVFYTAILGFVVSRREEIISIIASRSCFYSLHPMLFLGLFIFLVIGIYHLFATVFPRLKNVGGRSLFYFGTVADMKAEDYLMDCERATAEDAQRQLTEQIHANSMITNIKMKNIQKSTKMLVLSGAMVMLIYFI